MRNQILPWCWNISVVRFKQLRRQVGKLCVALSIMTNELQRASTALSKFSDAMRATSEETDTQSS